MSAREGQQAADLRNRRVLIVEDEPIVGLLLYDEMVDAGAEAIGPAATLEEAFWLARVSLEDGGLDAAILDDYLGDERVLPLADWLKEQGVPFLFASGYGSAMERVGHRDAPALVKPFSSDQLIAAVQTVIERRRWR